MHVEAGGLRALVVGIGNDSLFRWIHRQRRTKLVSRGLIFRILELKRCHSLTHLHLHHVVGRVEWRLLVTLVACRSYRGQNLLHISE